MTKTKPVRLSQGLMQTATTAAVNNNRTSAEQIEHWALLGQQAAKTITLNDMLDVLCGIALLKVEEIMSPTTNPDHVFDSLEMDRESNKLSKSISGSSVRYQASLKHPGLLDQIDSDGHITTGQFNNGIFMPKITGHK